MSVSVSRIPLVSPFRFISLSYFLVLPSSSSYASRTSIRADFNGYYSLKRSRSNHWFLVMEFPKDPASTRVQMIDTYLNTVATVLRSMEEAKKNMHAFGTTTYTGFQCTLDEETSEKFEVNRNMRAEDMKDEEMFVLLKPEDPEKRHNST